MKLLEKAKEDKYGNLYIEQKEFDNDEIVKDLGDERWYFSLSNTVCDDLVEEFCSKEKEGFELYDRHFWNDDTLQVKIINNGNLKNVEEQYRQEYKQVIEQEEIVMDKLTRIEKLILEAIRNGKGSYAELTEILYNRETDMSALNNIRVIAHRIRKKGYNIQAVDNWGYKEGTNE